MQIQTPQTNKCVVDLSTRREAVRALPAGTSYMHCQNWKPDLQKDRAIIPAGNLEVAIIWSADEGVVIDIWERDGESPLETTYAYFSDSEKFNPDKPPEAFSGFIPNMIERYDDREGRYQAVRISIGPLFVVVADIGNMVRVIVTDDPLYHVLDRNHNRIVLIRASYR